MQRAVLAQVVVGIATFFVLVIPASAEDGKRGGLREDGNRRPLYAARREGGTALPYVAVRVGEERRYALSASGREQLALRPAQVGAGGRVFVFAKVPPDAGDTEFPAEFLVWRAGRWERRQVLEKPTGNLGHVSATLIVDDAPAGAIPTAVFRRQAQGGKAHSVVTTAVEVPSRARLKFGYSFDEWDWSGLAAVDISIAALVDVEEDGKVSTREVQVFDERFDPKNKEPGWIDASADLLKLADEHVRFVFRAQPVLEHDRLAPHLVWSAPVIVAGEPERSMPSVVLVLVDGVRAASLGCCGATRPVSPFLDKLFSEQGVIFARAVTQAVETIPAHMTLFTGLNPCVHQVFSAHQTLARDVQTFAQIMSMGGYATAAFTDAAGLAAEIGFGRGFDVYNQDSSLELWSIDGTARGVFAHAARWIEKHRDEPFFVVVHTRQAKPPYVPPPQYVGLFKEASATVPGEDAGERVRYEREIRYLDDVLGEFVGKLDAASEPARTLLVVTSAHGEEFLEHGAREHGAHLYDETVRVPLMMRGDGIRAKRRHGGVVGLIDVAPTVLDLAGFTVPPSMQGASIAKQLRKGEEPELGPRFSEAHALRRALAETDDAGWKPPAFAISDSTHKLLTYVVEERRVLEAYNLTADPGEKADVLQASATVPPWVITLRDALETYTNQCRSLAREPAKTETLPVSTLFKLKAFGYL